MSDALHFLTIAEAARLVAARELSPVELTEAFLARIDQLQPELHAYLTVTADLALEQARAAETEIARRGPGGPLHGIPFALKDIYDTRGIRTTAHSALLADRIPNEDSTCTERLLAAGGVLLGKLATHEFATGGPAYDLPWPPARNPWRLDRFPGGSSSGAGAGVAAGLAPAAMGSDTAGSIRLPAAFCGLAGIKPTYGRVSKRGVLPLSWTHDTCGPLAWTVEDCAIVLQAIAGHDPRDPTSAEVPVPDFRAGMESGVRGMRVGLIRHFHEHDCRADDDAIEAMNDAVDILERLGATVRDVTLPPLADYQACVRTVIMSEAFGIHARDLAATPERYGAVTRYRVLPGALVRAADYVSALRWQRQLTARTLEAFDDFDVLLGATTYGAAPVQSAMRAESNFAKPPLTNPANVAQLPSVAVCNGFSAEDLPLSMQIIAPAFEEATALRVARAYERETGWRDRRPALIRPDHEPAPVDPRADPGAIDAKALAQAELAAAAAGLDLDEAQLADLAQAMPHVEAMLARIPGARDYRTSPGTVFRHG